MQHINNKSTFSNEYETGFSLVKKIEEKTLLRDYYWRLYWAMIVW